MKRPDLNLVLFALNQALVIKIHLARHIGAARVERIWRQARMAAREQQNPLVLLSAMRALRDAVERGRLVTTHESWIVRRNEP